MIGYVLFGTNNLEKSLSFYDQLLEPLNLKRGPNTERVHLYTDGRANVWGMYACRWWRCIKWNGTM